MNDEYTIKEFKTTKALVIKLLDTEERCRNDDKFLTFRVFEEISRANGEGIFLSFKIWEKFPSFATIKRLRAKIQNVDGQYLPTSEEVIKKRKQRQRTISSLMAKG